ncbi:MAG: DNA repair protein RecO [Peptoniphilaceae bacterium]
MDTINGKIRSEIIVLSEQKYKETSKILRVFSREMGKLNILAKGSLNPKSPLIAISSIFSNSEAYISKGKSFYYISSGKILNSNYNIRKNYDSLIMGSYLLELVDKVFLEGDVNKKIFDLLKKTLLLLPTTKSVYSLIIAFELKFLTFLGYRPNLDSGNKKKYFSIVEGKFLEEHNNNLLTYKISEKNIYYLNKLLYTSLDKIEDELDQSELLYIQNIVLHYIKYNLDIENFNSLLLL